MNMARGVIYVENNNGPPWEEYESNGSRPIRLEAQAGVKDFMERVNDWLSSRNIGLI